MLPNDPSKIAPELRSVALVMQRSPDPLIRQAGELVECIALLDSEGQGVPSDIVATAHTVAFAYLLQGR